MKRCTKCGEEKPLTEFNAHSGSRDGKLPRCKTCTRKESNLYYRTERAKKRRDANKAGRAASNRRYRLRNWDVYVKRRAVSRSKSRAKKKGLCSDISWQDIAWPSHCPVLGIKLDYQRKEKGLAHPNSPSLDRIDPSKGYVKGNVMVISCEANLIKQNCTDPDVFRRIADYVDIFT